MGAAKQVLPSVRGGRVQGRPGYTTIVQGVQGPQGDQRGRVQGKEGRDIWDGGEWCVEQHKFVLHGKLPMPLCVGAV